MNLKLLTLNAHSLHGDEGERKRKMKGICDLLAEERPDLIAMQEVNQEADAPYIDIEKSYKHLCALDSLDSLEEK